VFGQSRQVRLLRMELVQISDDAGNSFIIVHAGSLPPKTGRAHPVLAAICGAFLSEERDHVPNSVSARSVSATCQPISASFIRALGGDSPNSVETPR
jgi:hypothetical protein